MPFLKYRDNDSGLRPSSYPYILGRALNHYKIKPAVSICILDNTLQAEADFDPKFVNLCGFKSFLQQARILAHTTKSFIFKSCIIS